MIELEGVERIHLMGIGGAGMSSLAKLLYGLGYSVSGCDLARSPYLNELESLGIKLTIGHSEKHIENFNPQLVVYSSAVSLKHEELTAASARGIQTAGRGKVLSWLFNSEDGIGVAGAHGKTTTSSMIGLILKAAGLSPTLYIGAEVCDLGTNAVWGDGRLFVAEIDESDGSFEYFHPAVTVVTNVDWDHVNYFPTKNDVIEAFIRFAKNRKAGTPLFVCAEDEGVQLLLNALSESKPAEGSVIRCGWGKAWDWGAFDVKPIPGGGISCLVSNGGKVLGTLELAVSGEHNILNALLACAVASYIGLEFDFAARVLQTFKGAKHRLQKLASWEGIDVIDDYAHHPTEIEASISAIRGSFPDRRIVAVFQPHRYTRTKAFMDTIAFALDKADVALIMPIYAASEAPIEGVSSEAILKKMKKTELSCLCRDEEEACECLDTLLRSGDIILTLGAGSISHLGVRFLERKSYIH